MFSRITRLEFFIVVAVLTILAFCTRPPTSGNADVFTGSVSTANAPSSTPVVTPPPAPEPSVPQVEPDAEPNPDEPPALVEARQRYKRVGIVDARNCPGLKYDKVMCGEIGVRWVWNGEKLVPQKVCIVEEGNGVKSVWGFDTNDEIVLSEHPQGSTAHPQPRP